MSHVSTACFAPTLSWRSRNPEYGAKCQPTYGPNADTPQFKRQVGLENHATTKRRTRSSTPTGARGWAARDQSSLHKWATFWQSDPVARGENELPPPDLSPTKQLPEVVKVGAPERELRHDVHEDNRWSLQHTNPKPEKILRWQYGRNESKHIAEHVAPARSQPQDHWNAEQLTDNTLMRNKNWCNLDRPRRLEPTQSTQRMWTPRIRPKTPGPVMMRQRGTDTRLELKIPEPEDRDPNNPRDCKNMQLQGFGFQDPEHTFPVVDKSKAKEYERHSDYLVDRTTHQRVEHDPKDKFITPVTTQMELGWQAAAPWVYEPICGMSPSKKDLLQGLPRMSMAGGTSGRLCSPMSKFIDNVLMTRPGFNAF